MGFQDAIAAGLRNWLDFEGRASRSEYWWWVLFSVLANVLGSIVLNGLASLLLLILIVPGIAVTVRRLHDIDRTGLWLLIFFVPLGWILLLVWHCCEGTRGANQYGSDPLRPDYNPTTLPMRSEFDNVMDDSYRKSRIPRSGHDD